MSFCCVESDVHRAAIVRLRQTRRNLTIAALLKRCRPAVGNLPFHLAQAVVLLTTLPLTADELPAEGPLPQVGQLYVFPALLGNADDRDDVLPAQVGQYAEDALDVALADDADFAPVGPQVAQVKESVLPVYPLANACAVPDDRALEPPTQVGQNADVDRAADAPIDNADIVVSPYFLLSEVLCYRYYRKSKRGQS